MVDSFSDPRSGRPGDATARRFAIVPPAEAAPEESLLGEEASVGALSERIAILELQIREQLEIERMRDLELGSLERELEQKSQRLQAVDDALFHERRRSAELERRWNVLAASYEQTAASLVETGATLTAISSQRSYRFAVRMLRALGDIAGRASFSPSSTGPGARATLTDSDDAAGDPADVSSTMRVDFPTSTDPVASVVVIAWRDAPFLGRCLATLAERISAVPYEVIVAVNEPSDELARMLAERFTGLEVDASAENRGFGGAYNAAIAGARGEYVVLLNDDTEICRGWLESLVEVADRRQAGAVASVLLDSDGTIQEAGGIIWADGWTWSVGRGLPGGSMAFDYERRIDYGSAASLLVRRSVWERIGGFDPRYFPATFEDTDLCLRIAEAGEELWLAPRSRVVHFESQSTNSTFRQFLMDRNHAIFLDRWAEILATKEPRVHAHEPAVDRGVWRASGQRRRVLVIDDRAPDGGVGSGFARMVELLDALGSQPDLDVHFFASVIDGALEHDQLTRLGIGVIEGTLSDHLESIGVGYDCVVVSRPHNYERLVPLVRKFSSSPVIYDAEALYWRRLARQTDLADDPAERELLAKATDTQRAAEVEIARDANFAVCLAEEEAAFFRAHGSCPIEIMPPVLGSIAVTEGDFAARSGIGYVPGWLGGLESPNVAALRWFATEVMPHVRAEIPDAELLVTGGNPPETATQHASEAVRFLGRVEDLEAFYGSIRVVVSPMTYGAGVKIKTIEALQYGVPTVATTVGGEGVPVEHAGSLPIHDDPVAFAAELVTLLRDAEVWESHRTLVVAEARRWSESYGESRWPSLVREIASSTPQLIAPVEVDAANAPLEIDSLFVAGWVTAPPYEPDLTPEDRAHALREEYLRYLEVEVERRSVALTDELKKTHAKLFEAETGLFHERRRSAELERQWAGLAEAYEGVAASLALARNRRVVRLADTYGPRLGPLKPVMRSLVRALRRLRGSFTK